MIGGSCVKTTVDNCIQPVNFSSSVPYAEVSNEFKKYFVPCQVCKENKIANSRGECEDIDQRLRITNCKLHHVQDKLIKCAVCH